MRWAAIKEAVEALELGDDEEIIGIECQLEHGSGTLKAVHQGRFVKLVEHIDAETEQARAEGGVS